MDTIARVDLETVLADASAHWHRRSEEHAANVTETSHSAAADVVSSPGQHVQTWVTFFVCCLTAKLVGPYMPRVGMPAITGFIIVGIICGPYTLNIVEKKDLKSLSYINMFALAYITTSAGAELIIHELRPIIKIICASVTCISFLTFGVCTAVTVALSDTSLLTSVMEGKSDQCQSAIAMVMATICMARSPATAIAIVKELRCKGKMTTTFLGITVASDIFVLIGITITMSYAKSACSGMPFQGSSIGIVLAMIVVSVLLGIVIGLAYMSLMLSSRYITQALVFPLGFLVFLACSFFGTAVAKHVDPSIQINLEPLLMCIVGGFVCVNFSQYHHRFEECLNLAAPYIMLPFFTLVGAGLDLVTFAKSLGFAAVLCLARTACIFLGSAGSGYAMKQSKSMNITMWMTLLSQAGFSLGLAAEVAHTFHGWGSKFQAVIISCVVVNQLIGPILCKIALKWSKEAGLASGNEAHEEAENDPNAAHVAESNKCVILGTTPSSKALAFGLLKERWGVTMLTLDENEAEMLQADVNEWAEYQRSEQTSYAEMHELPPPSFPFVPLEDNFKAQPVPMEGQSHPYIFKADSRSDITSAILAAVAADEKAHDTDEKKKAHDRPRVEEVLKKEKDVEISNNSYSSGKAMLSSGSFHDRCSSIYSLLDKLSGLKVIVLALPDDLAALILLDKIQEHLRQSNVQNVRFLIFMQELRWAEVFSMLDAIPLHEFAAYQRTAVLATTTAYKQNVVLVSGSVCTSIDTTSSAFLNLFDGPLLVKCALQGKSLLDYADIAGSFPHRLARPSMKLLRILRHKMLQRKTALTGGRMLRSIDHWIQTSLDNLEGRDSYADLEAKDAAKKVPSSPFHRAMNPSVSNSDLLQIQTLSLSGVAVLKKDQPSPETQARLATNNEGDGGGGVGVSVSAPTAYNPMTGFHMDDWPPQKDTASPPMHFSKRKNAQNSFAAQEGGGERGGGSSQLNTPERLNTLKELLNDGLISQYDYKTRRATIIDSI